MDRKEIMEKIILSAIECIEETGIDSVTTRMIACKAGINSAMLHYYFGSKEQLIDQVMQTTLQESFSNNINDYQDLWESDTKRALSGFLFDTLTGMLNYPNITKSHFYEVMVHNNYDSVSIRALSQFLENFYNLSGDIIAGNNDREKKAAFVQMFYSVIMAGLMPDLIGRVFQIDLTDEETRKIFITDLVERFTIKPEKVETGRKRKDR